MKKNSNYEKIVKDYLIKKVFMGLLSVVLLFLGVFIFEVPVNAAESSYLWPVPAYTGMSRGYWYNNKNDCHEGIDILGSVGIDIVATKSGTVERVLVNGVDIPNVYYGAGNGVVINHGDGIYSHYAHMNSTCVSVGQYVAQGQIIGTLGNTGNSTGPHLHFSLATNSYGGGDRINNNTNAISYVYNMDSQKPTISNVSVTNINEKGYTVTCTVTDNVGVTKVQFPTWRTRDTSAGCTWYEPTSVNGNTYTFTISNITVDDDITTHIYAWDAAGNSENANAGTYHCGYTAQWIRNGGIFEIQSVLNGSMVMDVDQSSMENNANIHLYERNNKDSQKWKFVEVEDTGYYNIINVASGKVLDVTDANAGVGANLQQFTLSSPVADNQMFKIGDSGNGYYLISKLGTVIDVYQGGTQNGTNLQMQPFDYNAVNNRSWEIISADQEKPVLDKVEILEQTESQVKVHVEAHDNNCIEKISFDFVYFYDEEKKTGIRLGATGRYDDWSYDINEKVYSGDITIELDEEVEVFGDKFVTNGVQVGGIRGLHAYVTDVNGNTSKGSYSVGFYNDCGENIPEYTVNSENYVYTVNLHVGESVTYDELLELASEEHSITGGKYNGRLYNCCKSGSEVVEKKEKIYTALASGSEYMYFVGNNLSTGGFDFEEDGRPVMWAYKIVVSEAGTTPEPEPTPEPDQEPQETEIQLQAKLENGKLIFTWNALEESAEYSIVYGLEESELAVAEKNNVYEVSGLTAAGDNVTYTCSTEIYATQPGGVWFRVIMNNGKEVKRSNAVHIDDWDGDGKADIPESDTTDTSDKENSETPTISDTGNSQNSTVDQGEKITLGTLGVTIVAVSKESIKFSFSCAAEDVGYQIQYSTNAELSNPIIRKWSISTKNYEYHLWTGLTPDTTYYFKIRAFQQVGESFEYSEWTPVMSQKTAANIIEKEKEQTVSIPKISLKKVISSKKKQINVTWKYNYKVDGYQISYSKKKNFSGAKVKNIGGAYKSSKTISGLSKGMKYYVRIRGYIKDNSGKKIYGKWSSKKSVKVKK